MPKIIVQADQPNTPGQVTLSERVVAAHLLDHHYAGQLIERLTWPPLTPKPSRHKLWRPRRSLTRRRHPSKDCAANVLPKKSGRNVGDRRCHDHATGTEPSASPQRR
jgi:hypothetical protein